MSMLRQLFIGILAGSFLSFATAQEVGIDDIVLAFDQGHYDRAADLCEEVASADAYGVGAQALLAALIVANSESDPDTLNRVDRLVDRALEIEPQHDAARLQKAVSLSMRTRGMSRLDVWNSGYAQTARELAQSVLDDDPDNMYADGFLSIWNIEAVRIGGRFGASFVGASLKAGHQHYKQAVRLNPDDVGLHWQYARALTLLDARKYRVEIDAALDRAIAADKGNMLEEVLFQRAVRLRWALATEDHQVAVRLAETLL